MARIFNSGKRNRRCFSSKQQRVFGVGLLFVLMGATIRIHTQHSLQASFSSPVAVTETRITESIPSSSSSAAAAAAATQSEEGERRRQHRDDDDDDDRPIFTLHVGPPKTATTFLQCSLCANHTFTDDMLSRDGIVYLGTCPFHVCGLSKLPTHMISHRHGSFFVAPKTWKSNPLGAHLHNNSVLLPAAATKANDDDDDDDDSSSLPELHPTFQDAIDRAYQKHQNALVIFEGAHKYSASHIAALAHHLTIQNDWTVHIVVAYRRLYEWLPSKYNSITKGATGGDWPVKETSRTSNGSGSGLSVKAAVSKFQNKEAKEVKTFHLDGRGPFSDLVREIEETLQHPTETVKRNYARHFSNVSIIDLHNLNATGIGDRYLEHLVCRVLPSAGNTCRAVRAGRIGDSARNPSVSFHYDMLAVTAHQTEIYKGDSSRSHVASAIQQRQENLLHLSSVDYPLQCFSNETVARLLNLSLKTEQNLFADDWTAQQESEHRAGFAAAVQKRKYCSIDTSATLKDAGWQSFLRELP
jgi:hypothetical protein